MAGRGHVPEGLATRWLQAVLRFSRPDGSPVFGPRGRAVDRLKALETWANRLGDPSLASVVARWLPGRASSKVPPSSPPQPSDSRPDRTLAILRDDWALRGDLVAVDHREAGDRTLLEVASRGQTWLGPTWTSAISDRKIGPSLTTHWTSGSLAVGSEWSYKVGGRPGHSCGYVAPRAFGGDPRPAGRWPRPNRRGPPGPPRGDRGVASPPVSRALQLSSGRGKPAARLIPLGLPAHDRPSDRGSIAIEGREVVVRQATEGRRGWLPILIAWDKFPTTWRPSTVAYRSKACRSDVAVAARVAWGPQDEGLLLYRSLGPPELRCFLGHQTRSRFLIGAFTRSGDVRPILKIDE